jgi:hypothetical protein
MADYFQNEALVLSRSTIAKIFFLKNLKKLLRNAEGLFAFGPLDRLFFLSLMLADGAFTLVHR